MSSCSCTHAVGSPAGLPTLLVLELALPQLGPAPFSQLFQASKGFSSLCIDVIRSRPRLLQQWLTATVAQAGAPLLKQVDGSSQPRFCREAARKKQDAEAEVKCLLAIAARTWGAEGPSPLGYESLLLQTYKNSTITEQLFQAGACISDQLVLSCARGGIPAAALWVDMHQRLQRPTGLSKGLEAAILHAANNSCILQCFLLRRRISSSITSSITSSSSSSIFSTTPLPAAAAASAPQQLHDIMCVTMSCCGCMERGSSSALPITHLLTQHPSLAAQWSPEQVTELLQLTLIFQHPYSCSILALRSLPAAQQLQGAHRQQLMETAAEHGNLELVFHLDPEPQPLSQAEVLNLMRLAVRMPCRPSIHFLIQQPAARQLTPAEAEELLLQLVVVKQGYHDETFASYLGQLPAAARAISAGGVRRLMEAAICSGAAANLQQVATSFPAARQLTPQAVAEVIAAAISKGLDLAWVSGLPGAEGLSRELLLPLIEQAIAEDHEGVLLLARLPAAAALDAGEVERVVRAALQAAGRVKAELKRGDRTASAAAGNLERAAGQLLHHAPAAQQLSTEVLFDVLQQLTMTDGRLDYPPLWASLAALPAAEGLIFSQVFDLVQLRLAHGQDPGPLLELAVMQEQLTVNQTHTLLLSAADRYTGEIYSWPSSTMNTSLRLPAAQQLSVEQVHPLLLRVVGRGTGGFWSLPAAQAFSTEELTQLAEAIVQYETIGPWAPRHGDGAAHSGRLLGLPKAAGVSAELLCKMVLSALKGNPREGNFEDEEGWKSIEAVKTIRGLTLKQLVVVLGLGFEIGFVPEMLWRLPVAEEGLPVKLLQGLILKAVKTDGGQQGLLAGDYSDFYGLRALVKLQVAQQLSPPAVLRLLQCAVAYAAAAAEDLALAHGHPADPQMQSSAELAEAVSKEVLTGLIGLPAAHKLSAQQVQGLMKVLLGPLDGGLHLPLLLELKGAKALREGDVQWLIRIALYRRAWSGAHPLLILPGAQQMGCDQICQVLKDIVNALCPQGPGPAPRVSARGKVDLCAAMLCALQLLSAVTGSNINSSSTSSSGTWSSSNANSSGRFIVTRWSFRTSWDPFSSDLFPLLRLFLLLLLIIIFFSALATDILSGLYADSPLLWSVTKMAIIMDIILAVKSIISGSRWWWRQQQQRRVLNPNQLQQLLTGVPRVFQAMDSWAAALEHTEPQQQQAPGHAWQSAEDGGHAQHPWVLLCKALSLSQQSMEVLLMLRGAQRQLQQLPQNEGRVLVRSVGCCWNLARKLLTGASEQEVAISGGRDASATGDALQLKAVLRSCQGSMDLLLKQLPCISTVGGGRGGGAAGGAPTAVWGGE